jgi:signal transduction histidine kinase
VDLRVAVPADLDQVIEATVYFFVSEALTNVAKYAQATTVNVDVASGDGTLAVTVSDDGIGGADPAHGSGLRGLADRVEAIGGRVQVTSAPRRGTQLRAEMAASVLGSLNGR